MENIKTSLTLTLVVFELNRVGVVVGPLQCLTLTLVVFEYF